MAGVLVHEWIAQVGGSENVLQSLSEIYPEEDIFCLWNDSVGRFASERIRQTWLARTPFRKSKVAALPLMPLTWSNIRNRGYDWALVSSHLFAHHVRFGGNIPRFVYVHSPARYIWTPELDQRGANPVLRIAAAALKPIDRRRARETSNFAANSEFVKRRVEKAWGVTARVIYPPVAVSHIQAIESWNSRLEDSERTVLERLPQGFLLGASRFIPYKRLSEVIRAGELTGRPVVLAGGGPYRHVLEDMAESARVPVLFVDTPSTPMLYSLYARCAAYVFPPVEDFGIMPVEAMAAGAPVVANIEGGAAESVIDGTTGALTDFADGRNLREAVEKAAASDRTLCSLRASEFDTERFEQAIKEWVGA